MKLTDKRFWSGDKMGYILNWSDDFYPRILSKTEFMIPFTE